MGRHAQKGAQEPPLQEPPPPQYYGVYPAAPPEEGHYLLLPVPPLLPYPSRFSRYRLRPCRSFVSATTLALSLFVALAVFFLWPSNPQLQVVRFQLNHVSISTKSSSILPSVSLDLSIDLTLRVRNWDFFSLDYDSLVVYIGYRGRNLGNVRSNGAHLPARGVSYVNATLNLDGIAILHDAFYLIQDLSKGEIPFDSVSEFEGHLHLLFFHLPLKARVSCEVYVDTNNQTVMRQDCYE